MTDDAVDIEVETPDDADETDADEPEVENAATNGSDAGQAAENGNEAAESTLADRVAEHDEALAEEVRELQAHAEDLEAELAETEERAEELESKLKRTQADFQNYKKRAKKRQERLKERAAEDLVERIVPVRDNLVRALEQDENADIRDGVESTLEELDRVLDEENVEVIDPDAGDEVDPQRHEVMMRVESDQPPETIADVYRPGYEIADKVLREAQITVSEGEAEE